jgi:hypothetical protein
MKKMFRFLAASAVLTASVITITSCSTEEPIHSGNGASQIEGGKEKATLKVSFAGAASTRAINDSNANDNEKVVSSATIFVFNAQNAYQADTTVLTPVTSVGANAYEVTFHAPTGNGKRVYVGLNLRPDMINFIKQKGLDSLTYSIANQEGIFYVSGSTINQTFEGNPMFNDRPVIVDIVPSTINTANVTVERMTSKITVQTEGNLDQTVNPIKASNATFDNTTMEFAVGNKNRKVWPMKEQSASRVDPNWTAPNIVDYQTDFQHEFAVKDITYPNWNTTLFTALNKNADAVATLNVKYALENTHKDARYGEVTYVTIKTRFTPDAYATSFDNVLNKPVVTTVTPSNTDTLHVVIENNSYYYYTDRTEAGKHVAYLNHTMGVNTNDYTTYFGNYCFFNVFLNSNPAGKDYQLNRNEYYKVSVAEIKKLGNPYPEIEDGQKNNIIGATGALAVTITVSPWSVVNMNGVELE